jgi:two-component sensor histidine kinase
LLKRVIVFFLFFYSVLILSGQNSNNVIDSLQNLVAAQSTQEQSFISDTSKIRNLNLLASKLISAGELNKGDSLANEALSIGKSGLLRAEGGESVGYKRGMAKSYRNKGNAAFYQENYNAAIDFYSQEVSIYESFLADNDLPENLRKTISSDCAKVLGNIGNSFNRLDNYHKALENYYRSIKIHEGLNDEKQIGVQCGNIGVIYYRMQDLSKALNFYERALKISRKLDLKADQSRHLSNIAMIFSDKKDYSKSLEYLSSALKLAEEENDLYTQTAILSATGTVYGELRNYDKALDLFNRGLQIALELDDKGMISNLYGNIGAILIRQNKLNDAEGFLLKALNIARENGELYDQKEWSYNLSELYRKQNKMVEAFNYNEQFYQIKDSIYNKENSMKLLRHEMNYEYEKREAAEKAEHEKQLLISQAEKRNRELWLLFLVVAISLVLITLFFMFRGYQAKRKYAEVLSEEGERKELLLQEVHHRINNNLQIISSLLTLQANSVEDQKLNEYLVQSQNRIQSLSVLHELLYQNDMQLQININDYINKVLDFHRSVLHGKTSSIIIESEICPVAFSAKLAVPVALIINELVTNSLKYAFDGKGKIIVILLPTDKSKDEWKLVVSDNGKGMPDEGSRRKNSLGLRLVNMMVKQIKGQMVVKNTKGTTIEILFNTSEE